VKTKEIRKELTKLTKPCVSLCRKARIKPDTISWLGLSFSVAACYLYATSSVITATAMVILNSYFDLVDGELARSLGIKRKKSDFIDHSINRFSDGFILFGLFLGNYSPDWVAILAIIGTFLTSYLSTSAHLFTAKKDYVGFERGMGLATLITLGPFNLLGLALAVIAVFGSCTVFLRFYRIYKNV